MDHPTAEDEAADGRALRDAVDTLARNSSFIVIDTPGRNSYLGRLALSMADLVITPLNDSFVDLDVLGTVDRRNLMRCYQARAIMPTVVVEEALASSADFAITSPPIGSYCEIASRCLVRGNTLPFTRG